MAEIEFKAGYLTKETKVINQYGIHARPAALMVKAASRYDGCVYLELLNKPEAKEISNEPRNCKSMLGVMELYITRGSIVKLYVEAKNKEDEAARTTLTALDDLIASGFGE